MWLNSPHHAVHDASGGYLGQEIEFSIYPLGSTGAGSALGVPLLTGTDCAERVWSVNASLVGAPSRELYAGDTTFTRVVLRKRNTFFSQWCSTPAAVRTGFRPGESQG